MRISHEPYTWGNVPHTTTDSSFLATVEPTKGSDDIPQVIATLDPWRNLHSRRRWAPLRCERCTAELVAATTSSPRPESRHRGSLPMIFWGVPFLDIFCGLVMRDVHGFSMIFLLVSEKWRIDRPPNGHNHKENRGKLWWISGFRCTLWLDKAILRISGWATRFPYVVQTRFIWGQFGDVPNGHVIRVGNEDAGHQLSAGN